MVLGRMLGAKRRTLTMCSPGASERWGGGGKRKGGGPPVGRVAVKYQLPVEEPPILAISNSTPTISEGERGASGRSAPEYGSMTPTSIIRTERSAGPLAACATR